MMNKLTPKKFALTFILFLLTASVFAQKTVTGKVTDSGKRPAVGATISVKGTTTATTSTTTGDFSIVVPKGRNTLIVSYVGFEDKQVDVSNLTNVSVTMTESNVAQTDPLSLRPSPEPKDQDIGDLPQGVSEDALDEDDLDTDQIAAT